MAAYVAGTFGLDPVDVLKSDYFDFKVKTQAANYWNALQKEAMEKK